MSGGPHAVKRAYWIWRPMSDMAQRTEAKARRMVNRNKKRANSRLRDTATARRREPGRLIARPVRRPETRGSAESRPLKDDS